MKKNLRFKLCIATAVFLTLVPAELLAHHSGDPKLDRAIEKANSEFIVAMKTGDAATIAAGISCCRERSARSGSAFTGPQFVDTFGRSLCLSCPKAMSVATPPSL
jgi:hypothetical protein